MKKLIYIATILLGTANLTMGQNTSDQNPNYNNSQKKYTQLTAPTPNTQGVTIQNTYEVTDWREVKLAKQELKATRKHELKKLRLEARKENRAYRNSYPYYRRNRYNRRYNRFPIANYSNYYYSPYYYNY